MQKSPLISNKNNESTTAVFGQKSQSLFFKPVIQPKLTINQPNDPDNYRDEQEADAVADQVMKSTDTESKHQNFFKPFVRLQRKCENCEEEEKKLQRKEIGEEETTAGNTLENYINNLDGGGERLPNEVRNFYEPRFGYDFSNVKVHTGSLAAKSAQSINALAYTSGNNIVFNQGTYSPGTEGGKNCWDMN